MKRIFAGVKIEPDDNFIRIIDEISLELRRENIRWVNKNNYHITLKFFGDTEDSRITQIINIFNKIKNRQKTFNIKISEAGIFSRDGTPKILWFDTSENEPLYSLYKDIQDELITLGYSKEKRPFKTHLTVGSIKYIKDKKHLNDIIEHYKKTFIQEVKIENFILFQSTLKPGGPIYSEIENFKLI